MLHRRIGMSKRHHRPLVQQKQVPYISKAKIDIIITFTNRFDCLEKCLDAVYREAQLVPLNIYIVDNASPADERQLHSELFFYHPEKDPQKGVVDFRVKRQPQMTGFPVTANDGAKMGRAPIIMFLSDDVELQAGTVEKVVNDFNEQSIGIVGIKLLFPASSTDPSRPAGKTQHIGLALNIRGIPIHPLVGWSADHPKTNITRDAWAVTGACFSVRRELFNKVGGFGLEYGKGTFEDCDMCLKVRSLGFRVRVDTNATAYHYVGATAEKLRQPFPLSQNLQIFQGKWSQTGLLLYDEWLYY